MPVAVFVVLDHLLTLIQTMLASSCRKLPPSKVSAPAPHTCFIWHP